MFSAWVGITMGMIHGGNSTSYWFAFCLHLGNMWPHNTALSGPSLSDWTSLSLKHSSVGDCTLRTSECSGTAKKKGHVEGGGEKKNLLHLLPLIVPAIHTLVNKWCAVKGGGFFTMSSGGRGDEPRLHKRSWKVGGLVRVSARWTSAVVG